MQRTAAALTVAGSDPSGGAGIQADLKTFHQFGVYGEAVITLITVQNTARLLRVQVLGADLVAAQIRAAVEDIPPSAAKTGALGSSEVIRAIADLSQEWNFPLVVDPVMCGKHGPLGEPDIAGALREKLVPRAFLLMPNLDEAAVLTGIEVRSLESMKRAAEILREAGSRNVLIKGGHLPDSATDLLLHNGRWRELRAERIPTRHTHGTGCTYSAAITAGLAKGQDLENAAIEAKRYIEQAIRTAPGLGSGHGPLNHFAPSK